MSLVSDLLPMIDELRGLPGELGARPFTSVRIRTRTWSGVRVGDGTSSDVFVALETGGQPAGVKNLSSREVYTSAGRYTDADFRVGPLTPAFTGGGYTAEQLEPSTGARNVERHVVLIGPGEPSGGSEWVIVGNELTNPIGYYLTIRRTERTA